MCGYSLDPKVVIATAADMVSTVHDRLTVSESTDWYGTLVEVSREMKVGTRQYTRERAVFDYSVQHASSTLRRIVRTYDDNLDGVLDACRGAEKELRNQL
jgi:hypothetical protein